MVGQPITYLVRVSTEGQLGAMWSQVIVRFPATRYASAPTLATLREIAVRTLLGPDVDPL